MAVIAQMLMDLEKRGANRPAPRDPRNTPVSLKVDLKNWVEFEEDFNGFVDDPETAACPTIDQALDKPRRRKHRYAAKLPQRAAAITSAAVTAKEVEASTPMTLTSLMHGHSGPSSKERSVSVPTNEPLLVLENSETIIVNATETWDEEDTFDADPGHVEQGWDRAFAEHHPNKTIQVGATDSGREPALGFMAGIWRRPMTATATVTAFTLAAVAGAWMTTGEPTMGPAPIAVKPQFATVVAESKPTVTLSSTPEAQPSEQASAKPVVVAAPTSSTASPAEHHQAAQAARSRVLQAQTTSRTDPYAGIVPNEVLERARARLQQSLAVDIPRGAPDSSNRQSLAQSEPRAVKASNLKPTPEPALSDSVIVVQPITVVRAVAITPPRSSLVQASETQGANQSPEPVALQKRPGWSIDADVRARAFAAVAVETQMANHVPTLTDVIANREPQRKAPRVAGDGGSLETDTPRP